MDNLIYDNHLGLAIAMVKDGYNAMYVSVQRDGKIWNDGDRYTFVWRIVDAFDMTDIGSSDEEGNGEIYSPAFGSESDYDMRDAMQTLLSFMGAGAEAYNHADYPNNENADLFTEKVLERCYNFSDEIAALAYEIEEAILADDEKN